MQHQTVPQTEPRTIKARYLTVGQHVVYSNGDQDRIAAIDRADDDVIVTFADGVKASYYVEEGVTVAAALDAAYRVAFDVMAGVEPLTFPAGTTTEQITDRIAQLFRGTDPAFESVRINMAAGEVTVVDTAGDVIEHGSITREDPEPDRWLTLAADLRQAADRIATLAGTTPPTGLYIGKPGLYLLSSVVLADVGQNRPVVDRIAEAFGVTPTGRAINGDWRHEMEAEVGSLRVCAYARMPAPEDAEKAALAARVAELEAKLAAGGAR